MIKTTLKIDGMMCPMCEAHVCDAIRKAVPAAKKGKANRARGEATFLTEDPVNGTEVGGAVTATGYTCLGVKSAPAAKGLFGWK